MGRCEALLLSHRPASPRALPDDGKHMCFLHVSVHAAADCHKLFDGFDGIRLAMFHVIRNGDCVVRPVPLRLTPLKTEQKNTLVLQTQHKGFPICKLAFQSVTRPMFVSKAIDNLQTHVESHARTAEHTARARRSNMMKKFRRQRTRPHVPPYGCPPSRPTQTIDHIARDSRFYGPHPSGYRSETQKNGRTNRIRRLAV